jgi:hypothetical protein
MVVSNARISPIQALLLKETVKLKAYFGLFLLLTG